MLLDVLEGIDTLRICTGYRDASGKDVPFVPDANWLSNVQPVFRDVPGWHGDISGARTMAELPAGARAYLDLVEEFLGVPVAMVSIGPGREQLIHC